MTRLVIDSREPDPAALRNAADVLRRGGLVAYPTDTLYGLAVDPRSNRAVEKLFAVKGRDPSAAIPLIASDLEQARRAGRFQPADEQLAAALWPGPLTIVVAASRLLSTLLTGDRGTVGVRVPLHAVARRLAAEFGDCITSTSANLSGRAPAITADGVAVALGDRIDLLLDGGPSPGGPPSTVVELVDGRPTLHRAGAIAWDRVLESLK